MPRAMSRYPVILMGVVATLLFGLMPARGAEQVTVERESRIHAEPRLDAPEVAVATPGTVADVLGKSGAWLNVKTPSATGWLFSFNVRFIAKASGTAAIARCRSRMSLTFSRFSNPPPGRERYSSAVTHT